MVKIAPITNITAGHMSAAKINDAFDKVEAAFTNTLSRDGSTPNTMSADFDMNSNDILNAGTINVTNLILGGVTQGTSTLVGVDAEIVLESVQAMKDNTDLVVGNRVRTLGYYAAEDGGGAEYIIMTLATHGSTPDGYGDHTLDNTLVAEIQHQDNRVIAEQFGIIEGAESSAAWQEAFWSATDISEATTDTSVIFSCSTSILTKDTLEMGARNGSDASWMMVEQTGTIKATTGGNLDNSTDATPVPLIDYNLTKSKVTFGMLDCNRICSGVLVVKGTSCKTYTPNIVRFPHGYGFFMPGGPSSNDDASGGSNHKLYDANIKQWEQNDAEFEVDADYTGECLVVAHKDWQVIGGTFGWSRVAVLLLGNTPAAEVDQIEGQNIYKGYESDGCGDFFMMGGHLMQGRPNGPIRMDNAAVGGPILIECFNTNNKCYFYNTDLDSGTIQIYGSKLAMYGASLITGGQNRQTDKTVLINPMMRVYANGANNPAGLELGDNNNVTVGFFPNPTTADVWAGDYDTINYEGRQASPGHTGSVEYMGTWDPSTASVFPTSTTAGEYWLVTATATVAGVAFEDGDLLYAIINGAGTTLNNATYTAGWYDSGNNEVTQLQRGVMVNVNAGTRYVQNTTAGIPFRTYSTPNNELLVEYTVAGDTASMDWDGTNWEFDAAAIQVKNWQFEGTNNNLIPVGGGSQYLGDSTHIIARTYASRRYWTATVFDDVGSGTPEGNIAAGIGSTYRRLNGGASTTFYVKESGTGTTGWVAK